MPFARSTDGTSIYYESHARPVPQRKRGTVLLVHGFASSLRLWRASIAPLISHGWDVVAFDLRGHGKSDYPSSTSSYSKLSQMQDMEAVLRASDMWRPGKTLYVVGHSMEVMILFCCILPGPSGCMVSSLFPQAQDFGAALQG